MTYPDTPHFFHKILHQMGFSPYPKSNHILYKNINHPEWGYFINYRREHFYELMIGNYTISSDFTLSFSNPEEFLRLGTVHKGSTTFQLQNSQVSSFSPSSFLVYEKNLKGIQSWKKGTHYQGTEIIIYKKYFDEIILPHFGNTFSFSSFRENHTYCHLPLEIVTILWNLKSLCESDNLSTLYLESKIIEIISILNLELDSFFNNSNHFSLKMHHQAIQIGKNRFITLNSSDLSALQKAHRILTQEACHPPTINALSKRVFLNEQKLKAGFFAIYHISIGDYTHLLRMNIAENLLSTTELSIDEISKQLGYNYSSNFIKAFKKTHKKTPLTFRKAQQRQ